jgi:hypothetical protein
MPVKKARTSKETLAVPFNFILEITILRYLTIKLQPKLWAESSSPIIRVKSRSSIRQTRQIRVKSGEARTACRRT